MEASATKHRAVVLGGGVSGLTCAYVLHRSGQFDVEVIRPTRGMAPANWCWEYPPYGVEPKEAALRWARETFFEFRRMAEARQRGDNGAPPVFMIPIIEITRKAGSLGTNPGESFLSAHPEHYPFLEGSEALRYCHDTIWREDLGGPPAGAPYVDARVYHAPVCDGPGYLAWLEQQLTDLGVRLVQDEAASLDEALRRYCAQDSAFAGERQRQGSDSAGAEVIVNCTGLAARELVPDAKLYGTRGQLVHVNAPWIGAAVFGDEDSVYAIPCPGRPLELGGTAEDGEEDRRPQPATLRRILRDNAKVLPSLRCLPETRVAEQSGDKVPGQEKLALDVDAWVGVRPKRKTGVRLELEWRSAVSTIDVAVIHNYGHGGSGMCCSFGCANDVLRLALEAVAAHAARRRSML